jgi:NADH:ubiquinone oxidoreductase subunit 6 (subunit J)
MMQVDIWFEQLEFVLLAGIVIFLAWLALEHRDIVYAAFFFGFMASFVSGFYFLLEAPFIAGMQIAVYTGGISALIVFAVLLLPRAQDSSLEIFATPKRRGIGLAISTLVGMLSASLALFFPWYDTFSPDLPPLEFNLEFLSQWLWSEHGIYVMMTALILLTAIVGAIAILQMDKAESLLSIQGEFGIESVEEPIDDEASVEEPSEEVGNE